MLVQLIAERILKFYEENNKIMRGNNPNVEVWLVIGWLFLILGTTDGGKGYPPPTVLISAHEHESSIFMDNCNRVGRGSTLGAECGATRCPRP